MTIVGLLIGTAVLWGLTYGVALPLARALSSSGGAVSSNTPGAYVQPPPLGTPGVPPKAIKKPDAIDSVPTGTFILIHVLILGLAGLLLGIFAGMFFIGIAQKAKMWPGMLAFIAASLIGTFLLH